MVSLGSKELTLSHPMTLYSVMVSNKLIGIYMGLLTLGDIHSTSFMLVYDVSYGQERICLVSGDYSSLAGMLKL